MRYSSTRQQAPEATLSQAITAGLAPDGGLYVPLAMPAVDRSGLRGDMTLAELATRVLAPFFADDDLADALSGIAADAFTFDAPLTPLPLDDAWLLELFHGPTAAFKDFGARFLAACFSRVRAGAERPLTIVVATSGDTGAAVAGAFHGLPGFEVRILYPDGRVSPRQAHQLGCFGDNVRAYRVDGNFDDCQKLAKQALADRDLQAVVPMSSANSISLGRLLPQMMYYVKASLLHHERFGDVANFIIPTGNLGNALACIWARTVGLPIGQVHLAANANRTLPDYFGGEAYQGRPSVATLANAMDVGAPSNFERLRHLYQGDDAALRAAFTCGSTDDEAIRATIRELAAKGAVVCPHTATALEQLARMREQGDRRRWIVASTAHPAKFDQVVEPLVGHAVDVPPALAALLARPSNADPLPADYAAFSAALRTSAG